MCAEAEDSVAGDLLKAAQDDDELCDVSLIGSDGVHVPAVRFVLAARCRVLKRMLYGSFKEAKSSSICLLAYESTVLRAVVEFATSNHINSFEATLTKTETSYRRIVHLSEAADFLGLHGLQRKANSLAYSLISQNPPLACAVWDEATSESKLSTFALKVIQYRPYVALDVTNRPEEEQALGGGIEALGEGRAIELFGNPVLAAGESFLFEMLGRWFNHAATIHSRELAINGARKCIDKIHLENIEPRILFASSMHSCPFISQEHIFAAVAKQALRASHHRNWRLKYRGTSSEERVLVEGAGTPDVNGIYVRIPGLMNGDLYTKQEVACGQQIVYTVSCSAKDDFMECRIFSSQILTHRAVLELQHVKPATVSSSEVDPTFQPVLQIISLSPASKTASQSVGGKFVQVRVSDGVLSMAGTLAKVLEDQVCSGAFANNAVVRVLEFGLYQRDDNGCNLIHIRKLSVVNASAGQHFGYPRDVHSIVSTCKGRLSELRNRLAFEYGPSEDPKGGLCQLYSCTFPMTNLSSEGTKVPRVGWRVEEHGFAPSPRCDWIPASEESSGEINPVLSPSPSPDSKGKPEFQFM